MAHSSPASLRRASSAPRFARQQRGRCRSGARRCAAGRPPPRGEPRAPRAASASSSSSTGSSSSPGAAAAVAVPSSSSGTRARCGREDSRSGVCLIRSGTLMSWYAGIARRLLVLGIGVRALELERSGLTDRQLASLLGASTQPACGTSAVTSAPLARRRPTTRRPRVPSRRPADASSMPCCVGRCADDRADRDAVVDADQREVVRRGRCPTRGRAARGTRETARGRSAPGPAAATRRVSTAAGSALTRRLADRDRHAARLRREAAAPARSWRAGTGSSTRRSAKTAPASAPA